MTGFQFKQIRTLNKITQMDVANLMGYESHKTIWDIEQWKTVPIRFIRALSQLIGFDLTNEKNLERTLKDIPEDYLKVVLFEDFWGFVRKKQLEILEMKG